MRVSESKDTVVLVHGLWLTGWVMQVLALRLRRQGFDTHIFSYKTVSWDLKQDAARLQQFIQALNPTRLHIVAYSLGGLVVRTLFHLYPAQPPGRVITLGSPHLACRTASYLSRLPFLRALIGRGMGALLAGELAQVALPAREVGVIAGTLPFGFGLLVPDLPLPNDGTVALVESFMPGATDYVTVRTSHTGLVFSPEVARQTSAFLTTGRFAHSD